jgi:hypothetical protein
MNYPLQESSTEPLHPTSQNRVSCFIRPIGASLSAQRWVPGCIHMFLVVPLRLTAFSRKFLATPLSPPCHSAYSFPHARDLKVDMLTVEY